MAGTSDAKFVGVDWGKRGWFSVGFDSHGDYDMGYGKFRELVDRYSQASVLLVDIPIGLVSGKEEWRVCDLKAKDLLEGRGGSVFLTPPRYVIEESRRAKSGPGGYREFQNALASINRPRRPGTKFSSQAWNITPMIAEVDEVVASRLKDSGPEVREVHPEVCFWALNDRRPMANSKKKLLGQEERVRVLAGIEPRTQDILHTALRDHANHAAADDVLDALAAAITAREGYPDKLQTVPENPPKDARGLPMEMVFYNPNP